MSKFFVLLRARGRIDLPQFFWNFTIIIKMIILLLFACTAHTSLALAGHGRIVTPAQLVVASSVAIILVVAVMPTLVVVVCAPLGGCFLVPQIGTALFVQVLSVFAVHVTGLDILVRVFGRTLLVILLVTVASATVTKLGVLVSTVASIMIAIVALHVQPVAPALVGEMMQLAHVSLLQLMMQLALHFYANLFDLMAL
jgi:hypothetical protein